MQFTGLHRSPSIHHILLEEPPTSEEMGWIHRTWVETEGKVAPLSHIRASSITLCRLNNLYVFVPTLIAVWKQHDIMEGGIERMQVADDSQATVLVTQDYVSVVIHIFLSGAWYDGCHLIHCGQVVSTAVVS